MPINAGSCTQYAVKDAPRAGGPRLEGYSLELVGGALV